MKAVLLGVLLSSVTFVGRAEAQIGNSTTLRGYAVDTEGKPVPYVYVFERTTERFVITDSNGWFVLVLPVSRVQSIGARRFGYQPLEMSLDSRGDRARPLRLVLTAGGSAARAGASAGGYSESLDRSGYYRRMVMAGDATFMTADQIEGRRSNETSVLLNNVTGITVVSKGAKGSQSSTARSDSGCTLGVVVDGRRADDTTLPASVSGALEIYPSAAAVPEELRHHARGCGLVLVWNG